MTIFEIREKIRRRDHLESKQKVLRAREQELSESERLLKAIWSREQAEADRLEQGGLAAFFYTLTGKKEERLDKEKREAYEAYVRYSTVQAELLDVQRELGGISEELRGLTDLENRLERAVEEKNRWLKANDPKAQEKILALEERISDLRARQKEIKEALQAGMEAKRRIGEVQKQLSSAENWGMLDMAGGGLWVTMAKHSRLDEAEQGISRLQQALGRFRTELADIAFSADIQVEIGGFLRFADYFWDNIFVDWHVQGKIQKAGEQVRQVSGQVDQVYQQVLALDRENETALCRAEQELTEIAEHG